MACSNLDYWSIFKTEYKSLNAALVILLIAVAFALQIGGVVAVLFCRYFSRKKKVAQVKERYLHSAFIHILVSRIKLLNYLLDSFISVLLEMYFKISLEYMIVMMSFSALSLE